MLFDVFLYFVIGLLTLVVGISTNIYHDIFKRRLIPKVITARWIIKFSVFFVSILFFVGLLSNLSKEESFFFHSFSIPLWKLFVLLSLCFFSGISLGENFGTKIRFKNKNSFNVYLFGIGGCGKSTLIKEWSSPSVDNEIETKSFTGYSRILEYRPGQKIEVNIYDYSGQEPSQVITGASKTYEKNLSRANAIFFVADVVDTEDDNEKDIETFDEQIEWLKDNAQEKIERRINAQDLYIRGGLPFLFGLMDIRSVTSVYLLVNKMDVIEELEKRNIGGIGIYRHIQNLLKDTKEEIFSACRANGIVDYDEKFISALNASNMNQAINDSIKVYIREKRKREP